MPGRIGTLYGIGVGPGDPGLITLKALRVLKRVSRIFASSSSKNEYSLALNIVRQYLNHVPFELLPFPMTREARALQEAWEENAGRVLQVLSTGQDAAFVTMGDPLTYSTYGYLLKVIKRLCPEVKFITIPGITSYNAAAALANLPLVEGEESYAVISGALGGSKLREIVHKAENIIILKVYRKFEDIYQALEDLDLVGKATCISCCGLEDEMVVRDIRSLKGRQMPYLSLIIIKKKGRGD
jgi:precorrin-2/cobalt-factor-2 C20-methyltransferase